jgi:hypothetical protein
MNKVITILERKLPQDTELQIEPRYSEAGYPNYRIQGKSNDIEWLVDVYPNDFFCIKTQGRPFSTCEGIMSLYQTLYKNLVGR